MMAYLRRRRTQGVNMARYSWFLGLLLIGNAHASEGETLTQRNPETGLESWKTTKLGVTLELTQLTPDQARAFFLGRGFEPAEAEHYAAACTFMTILRNESAPAAISYNLAEWRTIGVDSRVTSLKLKEDWLKEWEALNLSQVRKIAFEWSQLPSEQTFEPGDWNQGMTTFALPRGSRFDLKFRWTIQGKQQENIMKGVSCANDASGN
jgi:hypothetical protein